MKVSYNWLKSYFDTEIPTAKELEVIFTDHLFEVEDLVKVDNDEVFEGKVLPDRAHYLLCHKGVAREIGVLRDIPMKEITFPDVIAGDDNAKFKVNIQDTDLCRRYIAVEMENITVGDSPKWITDRLDVIGQKSINCLVDLANFVMLDIGQPMHVFDADKIQGDITVGPADDGEKIVLLTGEEVELNSDNLTINDSNGPLAIAGVKGGKRAEVTKETKRIVIESANFYPASIRRTSTRLNLRNDSSKRFENEITPELAMEAMTEIIALISEISPDAKITAVTDVYPNPVSKWTVDVSKDKIEKMLGITLENGQIENIMKKMDCEVSVSNDVITVTPPFNRLDIKIPEDIADEVGRIIGYENIPSILTPELESKTLINKTFFYSEKIKNVLVEQGFSETLLYSLVNKGFYEISYPMASDKSALRENLLKKMSESLVLNGRNADLLAIETVKIFEIGQVFTSNGEETHLAIGVQLTKKKKGLKSEDILKEAILELEKELDIQLPKDISASEHGAIWEINLDEFISKMPSAGDISTLGFKRLPLDKKFEKFSPYPFVTRDIAIFVPSNIERDDVQKIIVDNAGELCIKNYLFDVFEKDGKTSYAYRLIFQSFEKTLTDDEVNVHMENINKKITGKGWEVR